MKGGCRGCPQGGFRYGESDFGVKNDEKQAPEVKNEEKLEIQNFGKFSPGPLIGLPISQKKATIGCLHTTVKHVYRPL